MTQQQKDMYVVANSKNFSPSMLPHIQQKLDSIPDDREILLQTLEYKKPLTMLILSIFFGALGVDRFILKDAGMGVAKLVTRLIPILAHSVWLYITYTMGNVTLTNVLIPAIFVELIGLANVVLTIIDWFVIKNKTYLYNYNLLIQFEV